MIEVFIKNQKLRFLTNSKIVKEYLISTSAKGIGCEEGSEKTPIGQHKICEKIGEGAAIGTIFQERKNIGIISKIYKKRNEYPYLEEADCMTTRILRLEGVEEGINKGEGVDTYQRCVYIHGTPYEYSLGSASSHGCIRMKNKDIIELFDLVRNHEKVLVFK